MRCTTDAALLVHADVETFVGKDIKTAVKLAKHEGVRHGAADTSAAVVRGADVVAAGELRND